MITVPFQTRAHVFRLAQAVGRLQAATDEFRALLLAWDNTLPVNITVQGGRGMGFQVPIRTGGRPLHDVLLRAQAHFPDSVGGVPIYLEVLS